MVSQQSSPRRRGPSLENPEALTGSPPSRGRRSIVPLCTDGRQEIGTRIDVADHAGIADRDFHQLALVRSQNLLCAFVAAELDQLLVEAPRNAHRMAAAGGGGRGD